MTDFQKFINKLKGKETSPSFKHKKYGKSYYPIYDRSVKLREDEPEIYNKFGEKKRTFFLRDYITPIICYSGSRYFEWDRYNFGLPLHFYSHNSMLETMGNPQKRFGLLIESESILPDDYKIFDKNKGLETDFDLIFTYSQTILEKLDNARFVPFCAMAWNSNNQDPKAYKKKSKNISILSSNKTMCDLHKFRINIANMCKSQGLADTFGTFDGGKFVSIDETLRDYRFSICIENDTAPYFFTEKISSAFVAQTIPVYLGASKIDELFNPDGIIKISTKSDIKEVLKQCTKEEYERRLPAIKDNYERIKKYLNPYDFMYQTHLKDII